MHSENQAQGRAYIGGGLAGNANAQQSYATATEAAQPQTGLEALAGRLEELSRFAAIVASKASGVEERLVGGCADKASGQTAPRPVRMGLIGSMNDTLDTAFSMLNVTDDTLNRLRGAI